MFARKHYNYTLPSKCTDQTIRALPHKQEATPTGLPFLRETQVGHFVTIAALGGRRGVEDPIEEDGEERVPPRPPPVRTFNLQSFPLSFLRSFSFGGHGEQKYGGSGDPHDSRVPHDFLDGDGKIGHVKDGKLAAAMV